MTPADWTVRRLPEVADYKTGRTPPRAETTYWVAAKAGVPWVAISDMRAFGTVTETKETITALAFEHVFRGEVVPAGTLLMSFKLTIGRVATLGVDACHNEAIISIYPKPGVDQRYLGYFLSQVDYDALQDRQVKGNTLNQEKIDRIEIALPPRLEQYAIRNVLDLVRDALEVEARALSAAAELKRAAMQTLFTRGLRGEALKETEVGTVPVSWSLSPIGDFAHRMQYGLSIRGESAGRYPILRMNCQQDGKVLLRDLQYVTVDDVTAAAYRVNVGDILFNRTNSYELVGRTAIAECQTDAVFASYLVRVTVDANQLAPQFLNHFLNWGVAQRELKKLASRAVGQANISAGKLRDFTVPVPPLDEQHEIVAVLDAIDAKIDLQRRKRAVLDDLFKALLHKLMTGEIRVADLDLSALDDPSSREAA